MILADAKVATPPSVSVPSIVKSVLGRAAAATDAASAALVSAVIKTACTSEPAIVYSFISPRKTIALRAALPTGGNSFFGAVFLVGAFGFAFLAVLDFSTIANYLNGFVLQISSQQSWISFQLLTQTVP